MKVKPSQEPGHVIFDLAAQDVALLAKMAPEPEMPVAEAESSSFCEELNERATKITDLMEEILSRIQVEPPLNLPRTELDRCIGGARLRDHQQTAG
jgi:hypothetical protein